MDKMNAKTYSKNGGEKMGRESTVERQTYDARDVAAYLGISISGAFNLLHAEGFPSFSIGKRLLVRRSDFEHWLAGQQQGSAC